MSDSALFIATYPWNYRTTPYPVNVSEGINYGLFHSPGGASFYGAEEGSVSAQSATTAEALKLISASVAASASPEVIEARIANLMQLRVRFPMFSGLISGRISILTAKLVTARKAEAKTAEWSFLGKTGLSVGIVAGLAITGLAIAGAVAVSRRRGAQRRSRAWSAAASRGY